jgi:hypothetical protein
MPASGGGGGGGAAGPNGNGEDASGDTGGTGDAGSGGAGGDTDEDGSDGTEWTTAGSGGGGGAISVSLAPKAFAYSHEPVGTTQTIDFPAGAVAGDLCTIWLFASQPVPAISGWDSLYSYTWPSSNVAEAIVQRELTSADIAAGSLTITFGSSCVVKSVAAVWDGNDVALDVLGTASNATTGTQPVTLTAPGVTTTAKAELMAWFTAVGALGVTFSGPSDWTVEPESQTDNGLGMFVRLAYKGQDTAGATGDVSITADDTGQPISKSGAVLLALRQKVPAITLSATFPANLHVGDTGSFVVTATLEDGATGSLTITGSSLPDGMTVGDTEENTDGTFSATVSYTLTTEQTVTASFGATGGSVAATALVHEFDVQAAAGAATVVQIKGSSKATSASTRVVTFNTTPTAGNVLCILYNSNSSADNLSSVPAGWTRTLCTGAVFSFGMLTKTSDGTESSVTLNFNTNVPVPVCCAEVEGTIGTTSSGASGTNSAPPWAVGPTDAPPTPNSVPIIGFFVRNRGASPLIPPTGWTGVDATGSSTQTIGLMYGPPTDSAVNVTVDSGSTSVQPNAWINLWVSPP